MPCAAAPTLVLASCWHYCGPVVYLEVAKPISHRQLRQLLQELLRYLCTRRSQARIYMLALICCTGGARMHGSVPINTRH